MAIRTKRRLSGDPGPPDGLVGGELAFNEVDNILYYGSGLAADGRSATEVIPVGGADYYSDPPNGHVLMDDFGVEAGIDPMYLQITGGTLTGPLYLADDPLVDLGAATKRYVDSRLVITGTGYLPLTGGTLSGPLSINNGDLVLANGNVETNQNVTAKYAVLGGRVVAFATGQALGGPVLSWDTANVAYAGGFRYNVNAGAIEFGSADASTGLMTSILATLAPVGLVVNGTIQAANGRAITTDGIVLAGHLVAGLVGMNQGGFVGSWDEVTGTYAGFYADAAGNIIFGTADAGFGTPTSSRVSIGVDGRSLKIGSPTIATASAYQDFSQSGGHSYDVRLEASAGSTTIDGKGTLNIVAGQLLLNGSPLTPGGGPGGPGTPGGTSGQVQWNNNGVLGGASLAGLTLVGGVLGVTYGFTAGTAAQGNTVLPLTGGQINGNLGVSTSLTVGGSGAIAPFVTIAGVAGNSRKLQFLTVDKGRWVVGVDSTPETGGNHGSLFTISRFADNGDPLGDAIVLDRLYGMIANSRITLADPLTTPGAQLTINAGATPTGAQIKLTGDGGGNKTIKVSGNVFSVLNSPGNAAILTLDDVGNLTVPGVMATGGFSTTGSLATATNLLVGNTTATSPNITIAGVVGSTRKLQYLSGGTGRWALQVYNTNETGGNHGSEFAISRFADNGDPLGDAIALDRLYNMFVNSRITLADPLTSPGPQFTINAGATPTGAQLKMTGDSGGSKTIKVSGNNFSVLNSAATVALLNLDDAGNLTTAGAVNLPGDPGTANQAATKNYVDNKFAGAGTGYLPLSGGALSGPLIAPALYAGSATAVAPYITIQGLAGNTRKLQFLSGNTGRWVVGVDSTPETGTNHGSGFTISRFADNGDPLGDAVSFDRLYNMFVNSRITLADPLTAPGPQLTINASATVGGAQIKLTGDGGATSKTIRVSNNQFTVVNNAGNTALLTLDDAGNFGTTGTWSSTGAIYPSSPITGATFYLNADASSNVIVFQSSRADYFGYSRSNGILSYHAQSGNGDYKTSFDTVGNFYVSSLGAYKTSGGMWLDPLSDRRAKQVLGAYEHGLAEIMALKPIRYRVTDSYGGHVAPLLPGVDTRAEDFEMPPPLCDMRADIEAGTEFIGFIAQDVEGVMPEMVGRTTGLIDGETVDDLRTLDTTPLIFALVNAVQELAVRVAGLGALR